MTERPLFIPLKAEHFDRFASGEKTDEFRPYGPRWHEGTCRIGRRVTLSRGYGTANRLHGQIVGFSFSNEPPPDYLKIYGDRVPVAKIQIKLDPVVENPRWRAEP